jgi:ADP-ribose pyrophosphatase YjhB (NUDIX family)
MDQVPKNVEVITALIIRNKKGKILLATGKKWHDKWTVSGGHVEFGEMILAAAVREGKKETGLDLEPVEVIDFGEMINPRSYHRPVHFIYFDCLMLTQSDEVILQKDELSEFIWVTPEEGLEMDCMPGTRAVIEAYIKYLNQNKKP